MTSPQKITLPQKKQTLPNLEKLQKKKVITRHLNQKTRKEYQKKPRPLKEERHLQLRRMLPLNLHRCLN